jgi:hypothetical protein
MPSKPVPGHIATFTTSIQIRIGTIATQIQIPTLKTIWTLRMDLIPTTHSPILRPLLADSHGRTAHLWALDKR